LLYLNLSSNTLEGLIPVTINNMVILQVLNLSSNKLLGRIPPQLGSCVALKSTSTSPATRWTAASRTPSARCRFCNLQLLDVLRNGLTGALPLSLEKSVSLGRVNFSYNDFSGERCRPGPSRASQRTSSSTARACVGPWQT
jgi:Leucine-rich repeat (LRR) protein